MSHEVDDGIQMKYYDSSYLNIAKATFSVWD